MINEGNHFFIIWIVHHAVYDGWMMSMFLDNVKKSLWGRTETSVCLIPGSDQAHLTV